MATHATSLQYSTVQYSKYSTVQEARHGHTRHLPAVLVLTEHQVGPPVDGHTHPQLAHNVQSKYNTYYSRGYR